jgi:hypothetical protein
MSLTPADPVSLGLGSTVNQLGAINSIFGNQSALEVSLKVADSPYVRSKVAERLKLENELGMTRVEVLRWLERNMHMRAMRGGIIELEMTLRNRQLARRIVAAYGEAVRAQLAIISRNQTEYKRKVLLDLVAQASNRLATAQADYDTFRLQSRYSAPLRSIFAIGDRIPALEQAIHAKQVELKAQREFATDENIRVKQILAEIRALEAQLAQARSTSPADRNSVGLVVRQSTQAERLDRDRELAEKLYDNYKQFLLGTSVEELTATANIRVLEPAYIDPARQYNLVPLLLGAIIALLGLAIEFYGLRPPVADRSIGDGTTA